MDNSNKTTAVIGLGYIGLPTAAVLSSSGVRVIGVDVNPTAVTMINRGQVHIVEPGLDVVVAKSVADGLLSAQNTTPRANNYIVAVPTPFKGTKEPDLSFIEAAAAGIAPNLVGDELIILESTSPPGATERMANVILELRQDLSLDGSGDRPIIHIAHCPERVLPGRIMVEMIENDRIVGGLTHEASIRARELYAQFCQGKIHLTDSRTAEMAKLVENAYRDVNIAFANELSLISHNLGIDVWELITLANHHPRVNILQPGPGVGGHCIAVDPWFIVDVDRHNSKLIATARNVNDAKPEWVVDRIKDIVKGRKEGKLIALGASFKPDIDDLRQSPAVDIIKRLAKIFPLMNIVVVEPNIDELPAELSVYENVELSGSAALPEGPTAIALLVDHKEFKNEKWQSYLKAQSSLLIDTRGII